MVADLEQEQEQEKIIIEEKLIIFEISMELKEEQ